MSISRQNLTILIVSFKSEKVIHECIKSIDNDIKILVVDNSNDYKLKKELENRYNNVSCILSEKNLGMGAGNNLGLKKIKSDYVFILNPDVILDSDTINELIEASKKLESFSIIAPIETNKNYPNYKLKKNFDELKDEINPFDVQSVDGCAMLLNLKRFNFTKESNYFDEKFFMYLENDDLCKRLIKVNEKIYVVPKSKIRHLGGQAVNDKYKLEIELSRNWHWIWSKFYYNKKHYGYFYALLSGLPTFLSSFFKFVVFYLTNNREKKDIYLKRLLGFINASLGKPSYYRPKIRD